MKYVLMNQEMQNVDKKTIQEIGIPGLVLMERASQQVAQCVMEMCDKTSRILVIAGTGNNGGDALASARILLEQGYQVDYMMVGSMEKASNDLKCQYGILNQLGYLVLDDADFAAYDFLVEGIFGVGLAREVSGIYREVIERINASAKPVIAIDIPSGVSGDTGKVLGCAIKASVTVTFGGYKRGHLLYPGKEYCGETKLVPMGFHKKTVREFATAFTLEQEENLMPQRAAYSNKGSYGKVLIIAGNDTMAGAACFSGEAAYRMGAGLVKIISDPINRNILQTKLPECLFGEKEDLESSLSWCDCILFGPGIGVSQETKEMLELILKKGRKPLLIDADGLNTISRYRMEINYPYGVIITPHLMEAARLLQEDIEEVQKDLCRAASRLAKTFHATVILKDAATVVAAQGRLFFINQSGNHGMATGGSGDVLAGMTIALLGAGKSPYDAAVCGTYLHGKAGDAARKEKGAYSMIASDILNHIKDVTGGKDE